VRHERLSPAIAVLGPGNFYNLGLCGRWLFSLYCFTPISDFIFSHNSPFSACLPRVYSHPPERSHPLLHWTAAAWDFQSNKRVLFYTVLRLSSVCFPCRLHSSIIPPSIAAMFPYAASGNCAAYQCWARFSVNLFFF